MSATPAPDVAVLLWPDQADEVARLGRLRIPRLLLVGADNDPPPDADQLLDWVRVPADEREVATRVVGLLRRATIDDSPQAWPRVDDHNRLFHAGTWVALSPTEAQIARLLCQRFMDVVPEAELLRHTWRDERHVDHSGALRVHLTRLRHRLTPLGFEIRAVRGQGFVMQASRPSE